MNSIDQSKLPQGLTLEKPARNLAALATTDSLAAMRGVVLAQWRHKQTFTKLARHGIRPIDRLLFHGPPGNGKTMAAQWLAQQLATPLYRVRAEAMIGSHLGETQGHVGKIMVWLEQQAACVVLFDEVEMLFPSRELGSSNCDRELQGAASIFWQYLDRWEAPTLFIMATNMPGHLDPALLSRVELKIEFGPPTGEQANNVAHYWAEVLHEYGGGDWGPTLADRKWKSFRELFQAVQSQVREFVASRPDGAK